MTLPEAIAQQPAWIGWWLNWMLVGAFILPLTLLIWRQTRIAAIACVVTGVIAAVAVSAMYDRMGYTKLLGLPHIVLWTPLAIYLFTVLRRDLPRFAGWVVTIVLATILISLAFDVTDTIRYIVGNRTPLAMPAAT